MLVTRSILHADDDPQFTSLVAAYLKNCGYEVTPINDPLEVLPQLVRTQQRVVLLDFDMPIMNGIEVLRKIKAFDAGIQVILLTGLASMTTVLEAMHEHADACFFKPVLDFQPLLEALNESFRKCERWWETLDELSQRRRSEKVLLEDSSLVS